MQEAEKKWFEKERDRFGLEAWMLENIPRLVGCTEADVIEVLSK